jgi:hypothetical protein
MGLPVDFENCPLSRNVQAKPKLTLHLEHAESTKPACWLKPAWCARSGCIRPRALPSMDRASLALEPVAAERDRWDFCAPGRARARPC